MSNPPSNFPTAFDTDENLKTVIDQDGVGDDVIALHHNIIKNCLKAIEEKLGIDGSTDVTSIDYLLKNAASVDPGHTHSVLGDHYLDSTKHLDVAAITEAEGMLFAFLSGYWNGLPKGSDGQLLKSGATTISWADIGLEDLIDVESMTEAEGDILYWHEVATVFMWRKLPKGIEGKFLKCSATSIEWGDPIPSGLIGIWHGTIDSPNTIPTGWVICDGNNGTPNFLDKFVKSVPNITTNPGTTGGATTHQHDSETSHQHAAPVGYLNSDDPITLRGSDAPYGTTGIANRTMSRKGYDWAQASATVKLTSSAGGHQHPAASNLPSYYEIAFIMKT